MILTALSRRSASLLKLTTTFPGVLLWRFSTCLRSPTYMYWFKRPPPNTALLAFLFTTPIIGRFGPWSKQPLETRGVFKGKTHYFFLILYLFWPQWPITFIPDPTDLSIRGNSAASHYKQSKHSVWPGHWWVFCRYGDERYLLFQIFTYRNSCYSGCDAWCDVLLLTHSIQQLKHLGTSDWSSIQIPQ